MRQPHTTYLSPYSADTHIKNEAKNMSETIIMEVTDFSASWFPVRV